MHPCCLVRHCCTWRWRIRSDCYVSCAASDDAREAHGKVICVRINFMSVGVEFHLKIHNVEL